MIPLLVWFLLWAAVVAFLAALGSLTVSVRRDGLLRDGCDEDDA